MVMQPYYSSWKAVNISINCRIDDLVTRQMQ
uniref:Uncharacterized protein n=1 Tax=Rhizophora mucronata TaxID=61149 RepID=A0A2P2NXA6_RHIMU